MPKAEIRSKWATSRTNKNKGKACDICRSPLPEDYVTCSAQIKPKTMSFGWMTAVVAHEACSKFFTVGDIVHMYRGLRTGDSE